MNDAGSRLTRSNRERVFGGVCGGLAQYIGHDVVLVRVGFVALALLAVPGGVLLYLFAWMIIPLNRDELQSAPAAPASRRVIGVFLVVAGLLALSASFLPIFWKVPDWRIAGPILVIVAGIALLLWQHDRRMRERGADGSAEPVTKETATDTMAEMARSQRRLVRRHHGRKIAGVCAGMAEYFQVDPAIIRVIWLALLFLGGLGFPLYLILWVAMPIED